MNDGSIDFIFTKEQQELVAGIFGKNAAELEDWELCELLDELISKAVMTYEG